MTSMTSCWLCSKVINNISRIFFSLQSYVLRKCQELSHIFFVITHNWQLHDCWWTLFFFSIVIIKCKQEIIGSSRRLIQRIRYIYRIKHCFNVHQQSCNCQLWVITKNICDNSWHFRICFQEYHTSLNADHNGWIIYGAEDEHTHTSLNADHNGWIIYGAEDVHC
jgi:hypothetical protein